MKVEFDPNTKCLNVLISKEEQQSLNVADIPGNSGIEGRALKEALFRERDRYLAAQIAGQYEPITVQVTVEKD